jgi:hypothetical protein
MAKHLLLCRCVPKGELPDERCLFEVASMRFEEGRRNVLHDAEMRNPISVDVLNNNCVAVWVAEICDRGNPSKPACCHSWTV